MPQMSPLNWFMLIIYFSMIFITLNSLNYFNIMYMSNSISGKLSIKKINNIWKW